MKEVNIVTVIAAVDDEQSTEQAPDPNLEDSPPFREA